MKLSIQSVFHAVIPVLLAAGIFQAAPAWAQDDPSVELANPSYAIQGTYDLGVEILGSNFGRGATVRFLANCVGMDEPLPPYCDQDAPGVTVGTVKVRGSTKLLVKVDISEDAYVGDIDIEVELSGRKGKGTTLFKVQSKDSSQPNDCMFDFEAVFRDAPGDGVYSDLGGSYVARGGTGMRLDTNGSQKLERKNDTRFVQIDFTANGLCLRENPQNPAGATGVCNELKGVDMRIEHQIQEPQGLCSIDPPNGEMQQTVRINFLGGADPLLEELNLNGGSGGGEPNSFILNYGCQGPRMDPDIAIDHSADRVWISRIDEHTWIFEGVWACVTSQLGNIMVDDSEDPKPIRVYMPFAVCIEDIDGPANKCNSYFGE